MLVNLILLSILSFALLMLISIILHIFSGAPWVPSKKATINLMLQEAKLKPNQNLYDLGCGDARLLIKAEKQFQTKGTGYEHAPLAYVAAMLNKWIHRSQVQVHYKNFFKHSLKGADVIFLYLGPDVQKKLAPKLKKECKPGTLILSNTFHLPTFEPIKHIPKNKLTNSVYLYKVPRR
jgi:hypothetical protein